MKLSISQHWINKENRAPLREGKDGELTNLYANSAFTNVDWTPEQLATHIKAGKAFCGAELKDNWRKGENFVQSELVGIDFDQSPGMDALLADEFIKLHAFMIYPTPSHAPEKPRHRALFHLEAPITDAKQYTRLMRRLVAKYAHFGADQACTDPVRRWHGSTVEGAKVGKTDKVLSIATLEALPPTEDELRPAIIRPATPFVPTNDSEQRRAQAYADATKNNIVNEALSVPSGAGMRHTAFNSAVMQLIACKLGDFPGFENIETECRWLGQSMGRDEAEIEASIKGALSKATPRELVLDDTFRAIIGLVGGKTDAQPVSVKKPNTAAGKPDIVTWKDSDESLDLFKSRLDTARDNYTPIPFPFNALKEFGGMTEILDVGVLVGVVGLSGGMKTSFLETITDAWRRFYGLDVIYWGTEWAYDKMAYRSIQRYTGINMTDILLHELALSEEKSKVEKPHGKRLSEQNIKIAKNHAEMIKNLWKGKAHYIEQAVSDVDTLLVAMADRIAYLRSIGRDIRIVVFDYLQLLDLYSARSESERITTILGKIKLFCIEQCAIGIVASQVTKTAGAEVKNGSGLLEAESGQFLRSDKFNLLLTLNPVFSGPLLTDRGKINVVKNSLGKTGMKEVGINPARLVWLDVKETTDLGAVGT